MLVVGQALRLPATDAVALQLVRYATLAQQFVYFSGCDRTRLSQDQSMVSNICELSGSGVPKIWEG